MIIQEAASHTVGRVERNKAYLKQLFGGPFPGHAIIMDSTGNDATRPGRDFTISDRPEEEWVAWYAGDYRARVRYMEELDDDSVPYVSLNTNTGVFASAFGCPIHAYSEDTNASARPIVRSVEEADSLPEPTLDAPAIRRIFRLAELLRAELGPDAPIGVPDIQSPFDIAALVWNKEDFFCALVTDPDAVERLVARARRLLVSFLHEFIARVGNVNLCHCPNAWAPVEMGMWLSEDEAGSISVDMFDRFCLPTLVDLSTGFGGMFMHCCANADHQYGGFGRIPGLRGLNRVYTADPKVTIDAFPDVVHMVAWSSVDACQSLLDSARPETRFLFNFSALPLDEAKRTYETMRRLCPRR